jgi:hypothetical protein
VISDQVGYNSLARILDKAQSGTYLLGIAPPLFGFAVARDVIHASSAIARVRRNPASL